MRVIKENSKTNCPKCSKKKNGRYEGWCPECTYPEDYHEKKVCVICKKSFLGYGNNAQPIKEGLCCDDCNILVIKRRLEDLKNE